MRKTSVLKLVDELVLPLVVVVASRYLSIFLFSLTTPLNFKIGSSEAFHSLFFIGFSSISEGLLANLVSWLSVASVVAIYFGFILFRSYSVASEHLHPREAQSLHKKNLEFLIIEQKEAKYQITSWLFVTFLIFCSMLFDFLSSGLAGWVFGYFVGLSAAISTLSYLVFFRARKLNA